LRLPRRVIERVVIFLELLDAAFLAVERLHHEVSAIHLFDVSIDVSEIDLLFAEIFLRFADDPPPFGSGSVSETEEERSGIER
jgi:hypothetical protein